MSSRGVASAFLMALAAIVYVPAVRGPFLFDDVSAIVDNPAAQGIGHASQIARFWEPSSVSFRPVRYLSFALDWTIGGGSPAVFHLVNALLHGVATVLLWRLLLALALPAAPALFGALLFAVHPVQTEAVAYISGRKDVLCAVFYLLALHASLRGARARGHARAVHGCLFLGAGVAAFGTKEMALTLPAAALLLDTAEIAARRTAVRGRRRQGIVACARAAVAARPVFYVLMAALGLGALAAKVVLQPATKVPFSASDLLHNVPLALRTVAWHVRKALWPWPHVADLRGLFPARLTGSGGWGAFWNGGSGGATVVGLLLGTGLAFAAARAHGARRAQAVGGLLFFALALLPVANLVRLNEPAAEHFLYLPMAGLAAALAALAAPAAAASRRTPIRLAFVVTLALLAGASAWRAADWSDDVRFWSATVRANPSSDRAHNDLALALLARGDRQGARRELQAAIALGRPPAPRTVANLGSLARVDGDLEGALRALTAGLKTHPDDPLLLSLRGGVWLDAGRPADARSDLERVAALPNGPAGAGPEWARDRGVARLFTGDSAGAVEILAPAARAAPHSASLRTNLGAAYLQAGRDAEAEAELRAATALPDAPAIAHRNLAVALLRLGRPAEAAASLEEARRRGAPIPTDLAVAVASALRSTGGVAAPPPSGPRR